MASKKNRAAHTRTLGPIPDLERHLPVDWWRTLFNSVYIKTDGDVVENDRNTITEIDTIIRIAGLEPNDRILDLCCGQGRHSLELARRGFAHVTGLDPLALPNTPGAPARSRAQSQRDLSVRGTRGASGYLRTPCTAY